MKCSGNSGSGGGIKALKMTVNSPKYGLFRFVSKPKCFTNISKDRDGFFLLDMEVHSLLYQQFSKNRYRKGYQMSQS